MSGRPSRKSAEIGLFPPFSGLFRPFPEGTKSTWEIQKTEEKGLFPQISSDLLKPPSLKPPICGAPTKGLKKVSPGLRARSVPRSLEKSQKVSKKSRKSLLLTLFWGTSWLFSRRTFWTLRARRPGETFLRLFGDFGPGGPPVNGRSGLN